jgi:hypothetical protein
MNKVVLSGTPSRTAQEEKSPNRRQNAGPLQQVTHRPSVEKSPHRRAPTSSHISTGSSTASRTKTPSGYLDDQQRYSTSFDPRTLDNLHFPTPDQVFAKYCQHGSSALGRYSLAPAADEAGSDLTVYVDFPKSPCIACRRCMGRPWLIFGGRKQLDGSQGVLNCLFQDLSCPSPTTLFVDTVRDSRRRSSTAAPPRVSCGTSP